VAYALLIKPIRKGSRLLRRLDNSQFTITDYLIEAHVGAGHLFASTLRFQGGLGDQPAGLRLNLAGRWLLRQILQAMMPG
jgi:hypothetical protein